MTEEINDMPLVSKEEADCYLDRITERREVVSSPVRATVKIGFVTLKSIGRRLRKWLPF